MSYIEYMTQGRHKEKKHYMRYLFDDKSLQNDDPWWRISKLVPEFNNNRNKNVWSSFLKVLDELMSAYEANLCTLVI